MRHKTGQNRTVKCTHWSTTIYWKRFIYRNTKILYPLDKGRIILKDCFCLVEKIIPIIVWNNVSNNSVVNRLLTKCRLHRNCLKGSSDPSHSIFEINVGKSRIRHTATLKKNNEFLDRLKSWVSRSIEVISFKFRTVICRIRLFPTLFSKIK